jgi:prephenate dehydrogenase
MKRVAWCAFGLAVLALGAWSWSATARAASRAAPILHVGDVVRVAGTSTMCAVARRGGGNVVECLPLHPTRGTYASLTNDRAVVVVRFRSPHVAKTVFRARQHAARTVTCR